MTGERKGGSGAGWVLAIVAVVVVLGGGTSLLSDEFGSPSRLDELGPEYADGRAEIETLIPEDGTGTFTARAIATCSEGAVVRLDAGATDTVEWTEDEYRCDSGSFVVRSEWPTGAAASGATTHGTWTITHGTDDYGEMIGGGDVVHSTVAGGPDLLTGTIGYDY